MCRCPAVPLPVESRAGRFLCQMKVFLPDAGSPFGLFGQSSVVRRHRFGVEFIRMAGDDQIRLGRWLDNRAASHSTFNRKDSGFLLPNLVK